MDARRLFATFALTIALGLGVAACGGDNDPAGEPPTTAPPEPADTRPPSESERSFPAGFAEKVEPVCKKATADLDKLAPIEDEQAVADAIAVLEDAAKDLGKLDPPAENAEAYDRFVEVYRDGASTLSGIEGELKRGDSSALQRVQPALDTVATEGGDYAGDYGFTGCSSG